MKKTAVVMAYHNMGCAGLKSLLRNDIDVIAVFTYPDDPNENHWFDSVAELAASYSIPTYAPDDVNHALWISQIKDMTPDYVFSFYYRDILCEELINIPTCGAFNLHGSLLPKYRGRAPVNWVLANGETETGVTLHHLTPKPDDGDIVCQSVVAISPDDTAVALHSRLVSAAEDMLDKQLATILSGKAPRVPQKHEKASYFGRRQPKDGELDWCRSAQQAHDLIRAVTKPYPGAFTHRGQEKLFIWESKIVSSSAHFIDSNDERAGTIVSIDPLVVKCGKGLLHISYAQVEHGIFQSGRSIALDLNLTVGTILGLPKESNVVVKARTKVLILGVNGFIGNALSERLLSSDQYEVHGLDRQSDAIERFLSHPNFYFHEGDISIHREWIEYHVKKCDVVLPLVAIATPIEYTRNPLKVFELDFEENLRIVRYCVKYKKRVIFPSTSEVYGMCDESEFDEDTSKLTLGPINKQRWIYSCSKQLLDRVIWAYGQSSDLQFTLFRPFNWLGPRLDSLDSARIGSSRAITQLILNLVDGTPIQLIDGGEQKRCFTDVDDGIECLYRIIENKDNRCQGEIINIGNPDNEASIRELAEMLTEEFEQHPLRHRFPPLAGMHRIESRRYYGDGYEDVQHRRPSIENALRVVSWSPSIPVRESVRKTLDYFLTDYVEKHQEHTASPLAVVA